MRIVLVGILFLLIGIGCKKPTTTQPQRRDIVDAVFASGKAVSINEYKITANVEGYLMNAFVSEGDTVAIGQSLFKIKNEVQSIQVRNASENYQFAKEKEADNAPQVEQLKEQIRQASIKKQTDSINLIRYKNLIKTNAVSKADFDLVALTYQNDVSNIKVLEKSLADLQKNLFNNAINAKAQLDIQQQNNTYYNLTSEAKGVVLNIFKKKGDLIKKDEAVATISNGKMIAKLYVAEDDIQRVKLQQLVFITLNTEKNRVYKAHISKIYPSFDEATQSFIVEATFDESPTNLQSGTQMQANCIVAEKKNVLVVPAAYLSEGDSVLQKGMTNKTSIKTGIKTLEWVEVLDGLKGEETLLLPNKR